MQRWELLTAGYTHVNLLKLKSADSAQRFNQLMNLEQ